MLAVWSLIRSILNEFFLKPHEYSDCHCEVFTLEDTVCTRSMLHVVQSSLAVPPLKIRRNVLKPAWECQALLDSHHKGFLPDEMIFLEQYNSWFLPPFICNVANHLHVLLLWGFKYISFRVYNSFERFSLTLCYVSGTF